MTYYYCQQKKRPSTSQSAWRIAYENPQIENPQIFANPLKIPKEGIENPHKFKILNVKI